MSLFDDQPDEWERHFIAPEYAHALGIFTAYYNLLEAGLAEIAHFYMDVPDRIRDLVYYGMSNRQRSDFISAVASTGERNPQALAAVKHLLACFDDCVQNRNILLHAIHDRRDFARKRSSEDASRLVYFDITLGRLRQAADAARETYEFLQGLVWWLADRSRGERQTTLFNGGVRPPEPLPEIPPRPSRLIPLQLGPTPGKQKRPPRSSRAKSRSRKTQHQRRPVGGSSGSKD